MTRIYDGEGASVDVSFASSLISRLLPLPFGVALFLGFSHVF